MDMNSLIDLKQANGGKGFIIIDAFYLSVPIYNQSRLISYNVTQFIRLIFKDPLGSNYMFIIRSRNQMPYIISNKLIKFILNSYNPVFISKCFFYIGRLDLGSEARIITYVFKLFMSVHTSEMIPNYLISWMVFN